MNPKAGFNYSFQDKGNALGIISSSINGSFGAGYKEPARTDFTDNNNSLVPKPEQLLDYELGYQFDIQKLKEYGSLVSMNINGYYMDYRNQLVLTGALNDVGSALRVNVPKSYRTGIEIDGNVLIFDNSLSTLKKISHEVRFIGNISLSKNIIEKSPASWLDYATSEKVDSTFHNAPISYSPNYVGSIGVNYRIGFWKRTVNEERTISISKSSLNFRLNTKIVGQQYLDNTGDETRKLDNYNFTEFMINYNHVLKINKSSINFKFQVNNLFNQYYANNGYTWGYMNGSRNVIQEVYLFPSASRNINFSIGYTF